VASFFAAKILAPKIPEPPKQKKRAQKIPRPQLASRLSLPTLRDYSSPFLILCSIHVGEQIAAAAGRQLGFWASTSEKKMATPPEAPARAATRTPASSSMATPAAATVPSCYTGTPMSARRPASTTSRPMATMSLFRTPLSRTATPPADEDGGDGSQG